MLTLFIYGLEHFHRPAGADHAGPIFGNGCLRRDCHQSPVSQRAVFCRDAHSSSRSLKIFRQQHILCCPRSDAHLDSAAPGYRFLGQKQQRRDTVSSTHEQYISFVDLKPLSQGTPHPHPIPHRQLMHRSAERPDGGYRQCQRLGCSDAEWFFANAGQPDHDELARLSG